MKIMHKNLVIIEGLPGSGKSTTAKLAKELLDKNNVDSKLILEGNLNHPADYDKVAYFNKKEFDQLLRNNSSYRDLIIDISVKKSDGYFISYYIQKKRRKEEIPDDLYKRIIDNDIYELPLKVNKNVILKNWQRFVKKAKREDDIYIFECCFIQNPLTIGLVKYNASKERIFNYILDIEKIINKLNPILIYLKQNYIEETFYKISKERHSKWLNSFLNYYTKQGYGLSKKLSGFSGTIEVLKKRLELELEIYNKLNINKYLIDNSHYNIEILKSTLLNIFQRETLL